MKRKYLLFLLIFPIGYGLYIMKEQYGNSSPLFYGFAENKETELSHDFDAFVLDINVFPGLEVKEGDPLLIVQRKDLKYKIAESDLDLKFAQAEFQKNVKKTSDRIELLTAQKGKLRQLAQSKVLEIEAEKKRKMSLLNSLKSVSKMDTVQLFEELNREIEVVWEEQQTSDKIIDLELAQLTEDLSSQALPHQIANEKIKNQNSKISEAVENLTIYAPFDGVVGTIPCKKGEFITAFSTLLSFYEQNPTIVKGYVHESLILQVNLGDSLKVTSSLRPEQFISGVVIGLGSRIIEIPPRLRKMPEIKTYGREVIVSIPVKNAFLQKEKVMLNAGFYQVGTSASKSYSSKTEKALAKSLESKE